MDHDGYHTVLLFFTLSPPRARQHHARRLFERVHVGANVKNSWATRKADYSVNLGRMDSLAYHSTAARLLQEKQQIGALWTSRQCNNNIIEIVAPR